MRVRNGIEEIFFSVKEMYPKGKYRFLDVIFLLLIILASSLTLVICGEFIIRGEISNIYLWICEYRLAVLCTIIFVSILLILFSCITGNIGIAMFMIGGVYLILCIVTYYKYIINGQYLSLSDFTLVKEAINIMGGFDEITMKRHIIWNIICFLWLVIILLPFGFKVSKRVRVVGCILVGVFIGSIANESDTIIRKLENLGLTDNQMFVESNYEDNGLLLALVMDIPNVVISKPDNYNQETVKQIMDQYEAKEARDDFRAPNVIIIQSEALFDITEIQGVELSEDPLSNLHKYEQEFVTGDLIVPVFGGSTAQTEYEVLTGNTVDFASPGGIAYTNYMNGDIETIVDIFKQMNYKTLAIHPYDRNFYDRNKVFKQFGFDEFIAADNFDEYEIVGAYISDLDVSKRIISEYEEHKDQGPIFTQVITMQNHAKYGYVKESFYNGVDVLNKDFSSDTKDEVEAYVNGLKHSDEALKYLIDYFENVEEPTVIMIYGDHKPLLGDFYNKIGIGSENLEASEGGSTTIDRLVDNVIDMKMVYTTPMLVWNNYGLEGEEIGSIDSSQVGIYLLDYIGSPLTKYFSMINTIADSIKAYNKKFIIDSEEHILSRAEVKSNAFISNKIEELELIQYDRLFGKRYSDE